MKIYNNPPRSEWAAMLRRPAIDHSQLEAKVSAILQDIKKDGDEAVRKYTAQFDGAAPAHLQVTAEEIEAAISQVPEELKQAIQQAKANIEIFHQSQREEPQLIETMPGVRCWRKSVGIQKVGLYIPGGTAPLFSTILMLAIPAKIAGCKQLVMCTPPAKDGSINPAILYTAQLVGVDMIIKAGGVQAIGAMAFGTETVPAVYKIFGPGNQYVTAAKQLVQKEGLAIDMPAGPSEVLVVADDSTDPAFVAADLLSQAEHGVDSQVVLVALDQATIPAVQQAIETQLKELPRKDIAVKALLNSCAIYISDESEALDLVNEYAPEHLILNMRGASAFAKRIINAGSVFIGPYSPESVGDYASGTNHTLPTNGYATAYSGVSLDSFCKKITFQELTKEGLLNIGPVVEKMAEAEQLMAHKQAVSIRLAKIK
ncbi:MAG: histidinol dehydrogenase [Bacteroidota bacterium]